MAIGVVQVRLFASLRDAAGTGSTTASPGTVAQVVQELCARFGEPFTARMRRSQVALHEEFLEPSSDVRVADGDELVLLPPFSGG